MTIFNDTNFQAEVIDSGKLTLVDFYADWCGPCKIIAPTLEAIASKETYQNKVTIGKIDIDANADTTAKYAIRSIPTLILFLQGEEKERIIGLQSQADIEKAINKHLSSTPNNTHLDTEKKRPQ